MASITVKDEGQSKPGRMFSPSKGRSDRGQVIVGTGVDSQDFVIEIIYSGSKARKSADLGVAITKGFPTGVIARLVEHLNIPQREMLRLLSITTSTYNRRREKGRLEPIESDRVYRYAKLAGLAREMFHGDQEAARDWLKNPAYHFNGESPLEHAKTEYGAREVETLIGRIRHGIPS